MTAAREDPADLGADETVAAQNQNPHGTTIDEPADMAWNGEARQ